MDEENKEIASRYGIGYLDEIDDAEVDAAYLEKLPLAFVKENVVFPLGRTNGAVRVAIGSPESLYALDDTARLLGEDVAGVLAPRSVILDAANRFYERLSGSAQEVVEEMSSTSLETLADEWEGPKDLLDLTDEAPIIKLLNSLLFQAVKESASDIHIEPYEQQIDIRLRKDGVLYTVLNPPKIVQEALLSRVKIMAGLDISEKRLPQDGRIRLLVAGRDIDVRVSTVPTAFGERAVLRLLDRKGGLVRLSDIGLSQELVKRLESLLSHNSGIILVTGPTGSGKTTTLYASISRTNTEKRNIITVEDPIEYQLKSVGQIQVNPKVGLTFASGLRSILRQDPDVIMVGEIRDRETAEIAIQASMTGHLVLSTLHTNDAPGAVTRLVDMGIESFLLSSSLAAVIAQRLVRVLCEECKEEYEPLKEEAALFPSDPPKRLWRPKGCKACFNTGYQGRTGIFEVMVTDRELKALITKGPDSNELRELAIKRGMTPLSRDGLDKAAQGLTNIEEVIRVTHLE